MSDSTASLRRKISGAGELQSVVRTMKAMAASNIAQYENSVRALADYNRTVELGLGACLRAFEILPNVQVAHPLPDDHRITSIVFGSDQGLVGQFNDVVADKALQTMGRLVGQPEIWAVGERVHSHLADSSVPLLGLFNVPNSVQAITPLIVQILVEYETRSQQSPITELYLFYNRSATGSVYEPFCQRLLPLDESWHRERAKILWPTKNPPQIIGTSEHTMRALTREYLFVSLFRACAESLASENASRLAAMQRADKNIEELLAAFKSTFHRLRQSSIDEELFDVVSGFEALQE